ncbi:Protein CBG02532 [Caenorhabditis briggsae]|uniref:LisH domain-containing protein n=2 Tax=Caenorhabditis briggsae TaxID=6238 RepID=A0AAE9IUU8_CAEBR|nr:Protein CBG02532 [Caenorhabditis briggsae]ULU06741.1 hypothetical protein L3Y34_018506 [Caenorhabditis briggsae]CAP23998.2 Protein CBG02532 [Caenorhabditis briggsae]
MKPPTARKPPSKQRPTTTIACPKRSGSELEDIEETPPDPRARSRSEDVTVHCLLREIDDKKLVNLIGGHPSARSSALILQALRQQMSVATLDEYVRDSLEWMVSHDVLMLKSKKNSLFSRVIQADGVDSREQMARLINTMASYTAGRSYFTVHHKTFIPCLIAVLRGKRLPSTTHDQLIACVQKMSIRATCQKELIQNGMLEWAVNHLDQKLNNYAFEYLAALIVNLSTNPLSHPLITRLADSIANSVASLVVKMSHGPSCSLYNTLLLSILSCSRIRLRAKDTKLLEAIRIRLETRRTCPLCNLHVPFLIAVVHQEVDYNRVPLTPTDGDTDKCGSSCEREIDSLDPLRPSTNELSGARLLIRKAYKETAGGSCGQLIDTKEEIGSRMSARGRKGTGRDGRIGTATSQHTFVIETERRRPLMINIGLSDGALEYKKVQDEINKKKEDEENRKRREKEKVEKEKMKALRHIQLTSRKAPSVLKKELSESATPLIEKFMGRKAASGSRLSLNKKPSESRGSPPSEKNNNNNNNSDFKGSNETIVLSSYFYTVETTSSPDDYTAVFGSRPKVARTPDTQSRSFF